MWDFDTFLLNYTNVEKIISMWVLINNLTKKKTHNIYKKMFSHKDDKVTRPEWLFIKNTQSIKP